MLVAVHQPRGQRQAIGVHHLVANAERRHVLLRYVAQLEHALPRQQHVLPPQRLRRIHLRAADEGEVGIHLEGRFQLRN
jgi:hypothetical protein